MQQCGRRLTLFARLSEDYPMVKLHTNYGVITLELFADKAPVTVENFKQYVRDGH
tara:strand:- start:111 stop:275 length:165 start_codon:yes stop_codon:yes gene_type:complete